LEEIQSLIIHELYLPSLRSRHWRSARAAEYLFRWAVYSDPVNVYHRLLHGLRRVQRIGNM
jgi:hypothetical protein